MVCCRSPHLGSPGWLLQRPESEKAAVHYAAPEPASLAGDPARRERIVARAHLDALTCILGLDAKKLVVVDLDGVLWPGVLAETGAPFAWTPEISSLSSWVGVYVGVHEALKSLKRRGVLLAAASKNDEAVVRDLWRWPENYPRERLLTPGDFVTWRIGWRDKAMALREIAAEVGFATSALLFIDDSAREREQVRAELPEVEVWGEDLYSLRRRLLDDPRLQRPRVTAEAARRTQTVKAQLSHARLRAEASDETAFRAALHIICETFRAGEADWPRVAELFARTTQFNATGATFSVEELARSCVYALRVKDRLADHGLVGAAVVQGGEIVGFALSCRVIGLGVEQRRCWRRWSPRTRRWRRVMWRRRATAPRVICTGTGVSPWATTAYGARLAVLCSISEGFGKKTSPMRLTGEQSRLSTVICLSNNSSFFCGRV